MVRERLGNQMAPDEAATIMHGLLVKRRERLLRLAKERAEAEAAAEAARKKAEETKRLAEEEAKRAKQAAEQLSQTQKEEME